MVVGDGRENLGVVGDVGENIIENVRMSNTGL